MIKFKYYNILQVSPQASADDIKRAYRKLAKKYHPDVNHNNKSAEEQLKLINEAYDTLKDPEKRAQYDQLNIPEPCNTNPENSSQPQPTNFYQSQSTAKSYSLYKTTFINQIFAIFLLVLYIIFLSHTTNENSSYNFNKILQNTQSYATELFSTGRQKLSNVYYKGSWRKKLIIFMVKHQQYELLNKLLQHWELPEITDENGYSLLMMTNSLDIAKLLLQHRVNPLYKAPDGETAISLAQKRHNPDMVNLLRNYTQKSLTSLSKSATASFKIEKI